MTASHVALDLALGTTGIAWPGGSDVLVCPNFAGTKRLRWWASSINRFLIGQIEENRIDTVVVEGPFMHPKHPNGAVSTIKLHGVGEFIAGNLGLRWCEVAPSRLKAWATGKGSATKAEMVAAARARGYDGDSHDAADAHLLYCMWADGAVNRGVSAPVVSDSITKAIG